MAPTAATQHSNKAVLGSKRVSGILTNATAAIKTEKHVQAKHVVELAGSNEKACVNERLCDSNATVTKEATYIT